MHTAAFLRMIELLKHEKRLLSQVEAARMSQVPALHISQYVHTTVTHIVLRLQELEILDEALQNVGQDNPRYTIKIYRRLMWDLYKYLCTREETGLTAPAQYCISQTPSLHVADEMDALVFVIGKKMKDFVQQEVRVCE